MIRDVFLGFIRVHILHHAAREPVYGLALLQELKRHGYDLSAGTMYPVLHGLERSGYLRRTERVVGGKVRKYYSITKKGLLVLEDMKHKIRELAGEVLEGRELTGPPEAHGAARQGKRTG